ACRQIAGGGTLADFEAGLDSGHESRSKTEFKRGRPSSVAPLFLFAVAYASASTQEHIRY
ncbi:MAG: hypothetical protein ACI92S_002691, partial [Planctomycetaceae bacterium]